MVGISIPGDPSLELMEITFKKWGQLFAPTAIGTANIAAAEAREEHDRRRAKALHSAPLPYALKAYLTRRTFALKRADLAKYADAVAPSAFATEVFNPNAEPIAIVITIQPSDPRKKLLFQKRFLVAPGYNNFLTPLQEIENVIGPLKQVNMGVGLANDSETATLVFGTLDFVTLQSSEQRDKPPADEDLPKIKCVVWDLDNTLWQGTLIEDGIENLRIFPAAVAAVHELDRRGILQSVASKNNPEEALTALAHFGLSDFFLYPEINWNPKSGSVRSIAKHFNIGTNTIAVIDDQMFEREEILSALPEVQTFAHDDLELLLAHERTDVMVTKESASRRMLYREEMERSEAESRISGDYLDFLRSCDLQVELESLSDHNRERVHELTQRTNQLNFSGGRYSRNRIDEIISDPGLDSFVISCRDKFGDYGIIGFALVDRAKLRMLDLMFSCRIQRKQVDVAALRHIISEYLPSAGNVFELVFRRTKKNSPNLDLFAEVGLHASHQENDAEIYACSAKDLAPDRGIVTLVQADR
jgi:FkbH-like protein